MSHKAGLRALREARNYDIGEPPPVDPNLVDLMAAIADLPPLNEVEAAMRDAAIYGEGRIKVK